MLVNEQFSAAGTIPLPVRPNSPICFAILMKSAPPAALGHSLEDNAAAILQGLGGMVVGHMLVPLGETDYSAALLAASTTGAGPLAAEWLS
jgi:hypothetical protein